MGGDGRPRRKAWLAAVACKMKEKKRKMKGREDGEVFIYKGVDIFTSLPFHIPFKGELRLLHKKGLRLIQEIRVWQLKLDAGINAASKKENARSR